MAWRTGEQPTVPAESRQPTAAAAQLREAVTGSRAGTAGRRNNNGRHETGRARERASGSRDGTARQHDGSASPTTSPVAAPRTAAAGRPTARARRDSRWSRVRGGWAAGGGARRMRGSRRPSWPRSGWTRRRGRPPPGAPADRGRALAGRHRRGHGLVRGGVFDLGGPQLDAAEAGPDAGRGAAAVDVVGRDGGHHQGTPRHHPRRPQRPGQVAPAAGPLPARPLSGRRSAVGQGTLFAVHGSLAPGLRKNGATTALTAGRTSRHGAAPRTLSRPTLHGWPGRASPDRIQPPGPRPTGPRTLSSADRDPARTVRLVPL